MRELRDTGDRAPTCRCAAPMSSIRVCKARSSSPCTPRYAYRVPLMEVAGTRLLLATTAQTYPDMASWNSGVDLGNRVVDRLVDRAAAPADAHPGHVGG